MLIYDSEALRNLLLICVYVFISAHVLIYINISAIRAKVITLIKKVKDYYIFKNN